MSTAPAGFMMAAPSLIGARFSNGWNDATLLVEDELEIQSFVKQSLTGAGYEVHTAEDGNTALSSRRSTSITA
jgi:ActR/RegA family two-component response regulator